MGAERRQKEEALRVNETEHATHEAAENQYREELKIAQEVFVDQHAGLIRQAFRFNAI